MWNFIKSLLSNRFGIVLATLNVCLFLNATQEMTIVRDIETVIILCLNAPAFVFARIFIEIIEPFVNSYAYLFVDDLSLYVSFFVAIQWLFIGWLAKKIAQNINLANTN